MYPDIQLVILEGREVNRFLRNWSARFDHRRILSVSGLPDHLASHRNRIFKWFRDECELPWLLTMDDDVVPVLETDELVACQDPVSAPRVWARAGYEMHPEQISMPSVKVHRQVVEAIQPPWFAFSFSEDGTMEELCDCLFFHKKLSEAGYKVTRAGRIGHRFPVTVLPGDGEPEFLFDGEVNTMVKTGRRAPRPWES